MHYPGYATAPDSFSQNYSSKKGNMTEIIFEDIYIKFPKGDLDSANTAKDLIDMTIKRMTKQQVDKK